MMKCALRMHVHLHEVDYAIFPALHIVFPFSVHYNFIFSLNYVIFINNNSIYFLFCSFFTRR